MRNSSLQGRNERVRRARYWLYGIGVLGTALLGAGCNHAPPPQAGPAKPTVVVAHPITLDVVDTQEFTGRLDAIPTVNLVPLVGGRLLEASFKEGDYVHKGDQLFLIDPDPYKADYNLALANLENSKANLELQNRNMTRAQVLIRDQTIPKEEFDSIVAARDQAKADVGSKRATLDRAKLYLGYTEIRADFDGRISRRFVDPGNVVVANQTVLTTLVAQNPIYAYFDVDERTFLELQKSADLAQSSWFSGSEGGAAPKGGNETPKKGQTTPARAAVPVLMRVANQEEYVTRGVVNFIDNHVDGTTGTIRLRAAFDNPSGSLKAGLFVRILLPLGRPYKAPLIPDEALQSDQGRKYAFVVVKDPEGKDVVEARYVDPGQTIGLWRVIKPGSDKDPKKTVTDADRIIVSGMQRVRKDQEVEAKAPEAGKEIKVPNTTVLQRLYPELAGPQAAKAMPAQ